MSLQDAEAQLKELETTVKHLEEVVKDKNTRASALEEAHTTLKKENTKLIEQTTALSSKLADISKVQDKARIAGLVEKYLSGKYTFKNAFEKTGFDQLIYAKKEDGTSYTDEEVVKHISDFLKENDTKNKDNTLPKKQKDTPPAEPPAKSSDELIVELKTLLGKPRLDTKETSRLRELEQLLTPSS